MTSIRVLQDLRPVYESTSVEVSTIIDTNAISTFSMKERSEEIQILVDKLSARLENFAEFVEIDAGYFEEVPCVSASLWHPAFLCQEWLELLDELLGESSMPNSWSIYSGIETLDMPADEYDVCANAPLVSFGFLYNRQAVVVDRGISIDEFVVRFQQEGTVPLA